MYNYKTYITKKSGKYKVKAYNIKDLVNLIKFMKILLRFLLK